MEKGKRDAIAGLRGGRQGNEEKVEDAPEDFFGESDGLAVTVDAVPDDSGSGGEDVLGGLDGMGADDGGGGRDGRHAGVDGRGTAEPEEIVGIGAFVGVEIGGQCCGEDMVTDRLPLVVTVLGAELVVEGVEEVGNGREFEE